MPKILFVCRGNVARSQMAEAYYNHYTHSNDAYSAGTSLTAPKKYPRLPDDITGVMSEEGIDVSQQKVKTITDKFVDDAEKIFVMCKEEHCPYFLLKSKKIVFWDIEDPYNMSLDDVKYVRDKIKAKVLSII